MTPLEFITEAFLATPHLASSERHEAFNTIKSALSESGANWESAAKAMTKHAEALQAKIDRLMLEHCLEEMTPEQIANWEKHQRAATPEEEAALQRAITAPSPSGVEEGGKP